MINGGGRGKRRDAEREIGTETERKTERKTEWETGRQGGREHYLFLAFVPAFYFSLLFQSLISVSYFSLLFHPSPAEEAQQEDGAAETEFDAHGGPDALKAERGG